MRSVSQKLWKWIIFAVTVISGLSCVCASDPPEALYSTGGGSGEIAFVDYQNDNLEIYLMPIPEETTDSNTLINLTNNPADDVYPVWSPDGTQLAFISNRDGNHEIYLLNPDTGEQVNLTNNPAGDVVPVWSPGGSQIAFMSDRDGNSEIYVVDIDSGEQVNLTNDESDDQFPAWSPDGTQIAFSSDRDGVRSIFVLDVTNAQTDSNETEPTKLTSITRLAANGPVWSPDGSRIAFISYREVYVINADGSGEIKLTDDLIVGGPVIWSPDGRQLVVYANRSRYTEILVIGVPTTETDTSSQLWLPNNASDAIHPTWSPDGTLIAFFSVPSHSNTSDLVIMNADGSARVELRHSSGKPSFRTLDWRPAPTD